MDPTQHKKIVEAIENIKLEVVNGVDDEIKTPKVESDPVIIRVTKDEMYLLIQCLLLLIALFLAIEMFWIAIKVL